VMKMVFSFKPIFLSHLKNQGDRRYLLRLSYPSVRSYGSLAPLTYGAALKRCL
jgi:hypothetical protein